MSLLCKALASSSKCAFSLQFLLSLKYCPYGILAIRGAGWELVACNREFPADDLRYRVVPFIPLRVYIDLYVQKSSFVLTVFNGKVGVVMIWPETIKKEKQILLANEKKCCRYIASKWVSVQQTSACPLEKKRSRSHPSDTCWHSWGHNWWSP